VPLRRRCQCPPRPSLPLTARVAGVADTFPQVSTGGSTRRLAGSPLANRSRCHPHPPPAARTTVYVAWTDTDGRRQLRTFPDGAGCGRLRRRLKDQEIPFVTGMVAATGYATTPRQGQAWRPDPRVWQSLGGAR